MNCFLGVTSHVWRVACLRGRWCGVSIPKAPPPATGSLAKMNTLAFPRCTDRKWARLNKLESLEHSHCLHTAPVQTRFWRRRSRNKGNKVIEQISALCILIRFHFREGEKMLICTERILCEKARAAIACRAQFAWAKAQKSCVFPAAVYLMMCAPIQKTAWHQLFRSAFPPFRV